MVKVIPLLRQSLGGNGGGVAVEPQAAQTIHGGLFSMLRER